MTAGLPRIEPLGENALLLRFEPRIDAAINRRVHALAAAIERERPDWLRELVPGYASLALQVDDAGGRDAKALARATDWLQALLQKSPDPDVVAQASVSDDAGAAGTHALPTLEIPVCYGGAHGPDLDEVARRSDLDTETVIALHAETTYTIAMLGFAPGFPYLLGLDPRLATPRLDTPRTRVPAGSVGIGGAQTGLYPREGPGGWRLIGRTPLALFDAARDPPTPLAPGRQLRFVRIDASEFARLSTRRRAAAP